MMLYCRHQVSNEGLLVFFNGDASVNTAKIKEYVDTLARLDVQPISMQVFLEDDLVVNITKHELVPRHIPLSDAEAKEVLEAFSLKMSMLPRILSRDPVSQYYGMKKGQMFRIVRKSETAGEYTTYRQVV